MSDLARAISIANIVHASQKDLGGEPYILHPLRIMLQCQTECLRIVAVLHDVVEDSARFTLAVLKARGFETHVLEAIQCLTKIKNEPTDSYMSRILSNPLVLLMVKQMNRPIKFRVWVPELKKFFLPRSSVICIENLKNYDFIKRSVVNRERRTISREKTNKKRKRLRRF